MDQEPKLTRRLLVLAGVSALIAPSVAEAQSARCRDRLFDTDESAIRRTGRPNYTFFDRDPQDAPGGGCPPTDRRWRSSRHRGEPDWQQERREMQARRQAILRGE